MYACIAPHGGELVPALAGKKLAPLYSSTRKGMRTIATRMKEARPDTVVVASPHNLRLQRHIGVVTSEYSSGKVSEGRREIRLRVKCDVELSKRLAEVAEGMGLPVAAANFGALEGPMSNMEMDWGTLIPLWFIIKGSGLKCTVVIVTPSRGIPLRQNFDFGRALARVAEGEKRRVAFVASADQAHAHKKDGPYGFDPRAEQYDSLVVEAIESQRLDSMMEIEADIVDGAKPDSLWQMAMLAGALSVVPMKGELLSYQVPTYYGMLCASYRPVRGLTRRAS